MITRMAELVGAKWIEEPLRHMPEEYVELQAWPVKDDEYRRTFTAIETPDGQVFITIHSAKEELLQLFRVKDD